MSTPRFLGPELERRAAAVRAARAKAGRIDQWTDTPPAWMRELPDAFYAARRPVDALRLWEGSGLARPPWSLLAAERSRRGLDRSPVTPGRTA